MSNKTYTAKAIRDAADLSYRQINDWDGKDALPKGQRRANGWRRYTAREVFAIMVCSELRSQFGVPVESLRFVRDFMLQDGANHFSAAVRLIEQLGVPVFLVTDFRTTFVMDSVLEIIDLLEHGGLGTGKEHKGYVFLIVNPIVNRMLSTLKPAIELKNHGRGYEILHSLRQYTGITSRKESKALELLRDSSNLRIEFVRRNGEIKTVYVQKEFTELSGEDILKLIEDEDFQTVRVEVVGGKRVRINQTTPLKLADD